MARDSNGNYSLPSGYKATPGETILASQHNPPLEDLASAMTGSLPRDGSAPMGGPLKTTVGAASSPAIYPNGNPGVGIHFANGKVNFVGGVAGLRFIGELIPYTFLTPEPMTVLPYGQTLLRASYPDLWAKAQIDIAAGNQFYNNGDGSTTFGIGDMRGRVVAGHDSMGGTPAGRLNSAGGISPGGGVIGATGGSQTVTLITANLPPYTPSGSITNGAISISHTAAEFNANSSTGGGGFGVASPAQATIAATQAASTFTGSPQGGASAPVVTTQPTLVCNYLLYAGA
jgi:microcystin-dependent protein